MTPSTCIASLLIGLCLLTMQQPCRPEGTFPGADWQTASPASQGVNEGKLQDAVEYLSANAGRDGVRELVVIRNGVMIWSGDNIDHVHGVWSLTKSFTSTVLGLLVDQRKTSLDARACEYVPELSAAYPEVSLRHFTTMTSGYRAAGDEPQGTYLHGPSRTPLIPGSEPLFSPPGSRYAYWDSAMNEFGYVLTRIAGRSMVDVFCREIAEPIGMDPAKWGWGVLAQMDGLRVNGGLGTRRSMCASARESLHGSACCFCAAATGRGVNSSAASG